MDPSFNDYFDKLSNSLNGIHADIRSNTTTIQAMAARLDDLVQWLPVWRSVSTSSPWRSPNSNRGDPR